MADHGIGRGRGRGRGTGRGISRGRGRGRDATTSSQPSTGQQTHPFISLTPTDPHLHRSTPTPHISSMESSRIPCTPSPSPLPTDAASTSHAGPSSVADMGLPVGTMDPGTIDPDGRTWIRPGPSNTFEPAVGPPRDITKIIKSKFEGVWQSYTEVDEDVQDMWYEEFQRKYKWLPEHEYEMKKTFAHKASDLLSDALYRVRSKQNKGTWIPQPIHERLEEKTSADVNPNCWDLLRKIHTAKGDGSNWVSDKSRMIATEYERRIFERDSQQTPRDDVSNLQSDNSIFLDVVRGTNKKGRIYGLGTEAGKYKPSTSTTSSYEGISQSEYERMKDLVTNLTTENRSLQTRLESHEQLIHSSREDNRLMREQMLQFMESFSQGRSIPLPAHPPSPTDQDN